MVNHMVCGEPHGEPHEKTETFGCLSMESIVHQRYWVLVNFGEDSKESSPLEAIRELGGLQ